MESKRNIDVTCPECRGPLSEVVEEGVLEYRCLVGHRYSLMSVLAAHGETEERMLWAAALALEEASVLARETAAHLPDAAPDLIAQGEEKRRQSGVIREVLQQLKPLTTER